MQDSHTAEYYLSYWYFMLFMSWRFAQASVISKLLSETKTTCCLLLGSKKLLFYLIEKRSW